ncbi:MAG TPA: hypothetical protein VMI54_10205 [Polyangiaceae bacterium]|nr:hypothetical protein [Polyangiaceae bacterium]
MKFQFSFGHALLRSRSFGHSALFVAPWLLVGTLSCASNQPAAETPPQPAASAAPAPEAAPSASASAAAASAAPEAAPEAGPIDWEKMDKAARGKYMKTVVMPKMKELFTAFDAKYSDMKCTTCHGSAALSGSFAMPNPELPKIPSDMAKFKEWAGKNPKMAEFMAKQVKPEMAKLLNEPEWTPATKEGFGCTNCHTKG